MKNTLKNELQFCLELWEKEWGCTFGWGTNCKECASPYLLLKLLTWEVLHGDMERLSLEKWKEKFKNL